ncbi:MAG: ATP-binding protein [Bacteroides sp.]|nr:ATP-binding protein [Bacteroides sp.]MCM1447757.1 ATP-binding protein [Bacteroides sp.]
MELQNLPIGIQNFEKIREGNYLYVDKTAWVYRLVSTGSYYFLSRPRRFGKSLLLSTLHSYFDGRKDLFEGLAIANLEQKWERYPVLHMDLNTRNYKDIESLSGILNEYLEKWEALYGDAKKDRVPEERFSYVIEQAFIKTGKRVVILIDEYDKPMLQTIGNESLQEAYRNTLKAFYGALKSGDQYIKFAMLTGVTKFGKVSVFSDLNNLKDISMRKDYHEICGITGAELQRDFGEHMKRMAQELHMSTEEVTDEMTRLYDGYHFTAAQSGIYNPFSVLNAFDANAFGSYWFETGTPTYLVQLLQLQGYSLERMADEYATEDILNSVEVASANPIPVIYQSGYLTIKDYDPRFRTYHLGFPNAEVEDGFFRFLLPYYTSLDSVEAPFHIQKFVNEIETGKPAAFLTRLKSFFADTPYELERDLENHYQNVLFIIFKLLGAHVRAEYHTSRGRIDMVLQSQDYTYVMEFKLDGTAEDALRQISDKDYTLPFSADGTTLFRIGMNFSSETRNIEKWIIDNQQVK